MHYKLRTALHPTLALVATPIACGALACLPDAPTYGYSEKAAEVLQSVPVPVSPLGGNEVGTVAAGVRWRGRVDLTTDPANPYFGWTASGFDARFTGTSIGVKLNTDQPNTPCQADPCGLFFQPVLDGEVLPRLKATAGVATLEIKSGLSDSPHVLEFYRETESPIGRSQFLGITGGTLLTPPTYSGRVIEFVADSITNGFGELGKEKHANPGDTEGQCDYTPDTQAGYLTYAAKLARAFNADPSIVALSGWGLYRGLFGEGTNYAVPLEYSDSLYYHDPQPQWDFRVKANAVVINLGTNDIAQGDPGAAFTTALGKLVDLIRAKNGDVWIFPVTGTMLSGQSHDWIKGYMADFVAAKGGDAAKLAYVDLGTLDASLGTGCIYHPDVNEHQRIVDVLYPVMKEKLASIGW